MATFAPAARVDGLTPSAPRHGLLSVATVIEPDTDPRWLAGTVMDPAPCGCAHVIPGDCEPAGVARQGERPNLAPPSFGSFTVYATDRCSTFGLGPPEAFADRLTVALMASQHSAIEREFWTGELLSDTPHLAQPSADTVAGGSTIEAGIAALEEAIAASCRAGVIHLTPRAATLAVSRRLIEPDGSARTSLRTVALGTPVAVGTGYPGTSPAGAAPAAGTAWAYASSPVRVRLSTVEVVPDSVAQAVSRSTNDVTFRAERTAVVEWDQCIHAGALLALA